MRQVKKLVCLLVISSSLLLPATAFASSGSGYYDYSYSSYGSYNSYSSSSSIFSQLYNYFTSNYSNHNNYNDKDYRDKEREFNDWYDRNRNNCPPEESYDIWKKWFCN